MYVFCLAVSTGVRLLEDSVIPPHALRGQKAVLRCNYDLEGDNLYSVKWYYNQMEFYRFIPSDNPKVTIFGHHDGVKVNPHLSTEREIVLDHVEFATSGTYRCEVSGDAPMFQTASTEGILFVVGEYVQCMILTLSVVTYASFSPFVRGCTFTYTRYLHTCQGLPYWLIVLITIRIPH